MCITSTALDVPKRNFAVLYVSIMGPARCYKTTVFYIYSKINKKMENSTTCKIVTPENFTLKLGTRDYLENITH